MLLSYTQLRRKSTGSQYFFPNGKHSVLFKQLSDASRLRIFWLLCHCEACGTELAGIVEMTPPAVAHHLRLLRSSHLLVSRREGKEVYYRAADTAQAQALHHMIEEMVEISCPRDGGR